MEGRIVLVGNTLVTEKMEYQLGQQQELAEEMRQQLNEEQVASVLTIIAAVESYEQDRH